MSNTDDLDEERLREMERQWADAAQGTADYYGVLNLPRTASTDDVRDAYKRFSRVFHPDRHRDAERREWAQRQFHVIQRAYEILTDDYKRAAYDQLGEEGLRTSLAVGYKMESARDLQEKFEREARRRRMEEIEQWVQSKSDVTVELDVAKAVSPMVATVLQRAGVKNLPLDQQINVKQLFMKHSFSAALSDSVTATVTGHMVSRNRRGAGNLVGTLKRTVGPNSWVSLSVPALPPYVATFKSSHQPSSDTFVTSQATLHTMDLATPPSATVTMGRMMTPTMTAYMSMRTGNQYALGPFWDHSPTRVRATGRQQRQIAREPSGVSIGLSGKNADKDEFVVDVSAGIQQSHVSLNYTRKLDRHFSVSAGLVLVAVGAPLPEGPIERLGDSLDDFDAGLQGLGEASANVGVEGELDEWTKIGYRVNFGLTSGVKATVHLQRLGHKIELPILLSPLLEPDLIIYAAALPLAIAAGLHYTVLKPRRRRLIKQRMAELKEEQRYQLFLQKRHAQEAVRLMAASVERSRDKARAVGGLAIESALYGDLPFGIAQQNTNAVQAAIDGFTQSQSALAATDEPRACDVALALQALVHDDQLVVAAGSSKRFLPGFYDPAFGVAKQLLVRYRFRGQLHEVLVRDDQALAIPMKSHSIAS
ncbi:hypothetical protein FBU59_002553 [Linderina macrospora]|uniref:Uncharacterized protein n=1 Tax=Linderina macrospora TaxID=4868 RepID=A0ACC1JAR3_9FUNG|nr:hypothetical protein FBU59_002553 [Linderina macrospora]